MSRPHDAYDARRGGIVRWIHDDIPDKRAFFEQISYKPHAGQVQIHGAMELANTVVCAAGVRCGKSTAAGKELFYESMLPREVFTGWTVAPQADLGDIIFVEVMNCAVEYFRPTPGVLRVRETDGELIFPNLGGGTSRIFRKTTYDAEGKGKLVGRGIDAMVCDEASRIRPDSIFWNELSTRLVDRNGKLLAIASPQGHKGWFAELYRRGQQKDSGIVSICMPSWTNTLIPRERWIEERAKVSQFVWDQEYAAKFVDQEGNVFEEAALRAAATGEIEEPEEGATYYAGIDIAMKHDYNAIAVLKATPAGPKLVFFRRKRRTPKPEQVRMFAEITKRYNNADTYFDATQLGPGVQQDFEMAGMNVRPIVWTIQSKQKMTQNLILLLEHQKIQLLKPSACRELFDELQAYAWKESSGGYQVGEAPGKEHDDCVSALMMAAYWFQGAGAGSAPPRGGTLLMPRPDDKKVDKQEADIGAWSSGLKNPRVYRPASSVKFGLGGSRPGNRPFGLR